MEKKISKISKMVKSISQKNKLMSIDPSINNLGVAIWNINTEQLLDHRLLHPKKEHKTSEYAKSLSMLRQLQDLIKQFEVNHMICEVPEHWAVGGFEARETGSIAKLCFVCGMIYSLHDTLDVCEVVVPRGWKGQLPKEVVANRLFDEYMEKYAIDMVKMNPNVMDAIGIGHYKIFGSV
jgi:hypothetical protein